MVGRAATLFITRLPRFGLRARANFRVARYTNWNHNAIALPSPRIADKLVLSRLVRFEAATKHLQNVYRGFDLSNLCPFSQTVNPWDLFRSDSRKGSLALFREEQHGCTLVVRIGLKGNEPGCFQVVRDALNRLAR